MHAVELHVAREHAVEHGAPRRQRAVVFVAGDAAVAEAQREGRVGRHLVAVDGEQQPAEAGAERRFGRLDLVAARAVGGGQRRDHGRGAQGRVVRRADRVRAGLEQLLQVAFVGEPAALDQRRHRSLGISAAEQRLEVGVLLRQVPGRPREVVGEQRLLHRVPPAVDVARPLRVRRVTARREREQRLGPHQQRHAAGRVEAERRFELHLLGHQRGQLGPDRQRLAVAAGLGPLLERALGALLARHELRVLQRAVLAAVELLAVLEPEDRRAQRLLQPRPHAREAAQDRQPIVDQLAHPRIARVALVLELRLGEQPRGTARVAGQQHDLADLRAVPPTEVMFAGVGRFAVDVGPAEREVDRVARVDEVVRVAAEVRRLQVRRHHQPDVVEHAVAVQLPDGALEQLDELRLQPVVAGPRRGEDAVAVRLAPLLGRRARQLGGHALFDLRGHVLHRDELLHGHALEPDLVLLRRGDEAVGDPVVLALRLGDRAARAVVVGQDQAARRHERGRAAAAEPQRRQPHAVPPRLVGLQAVLTLEVGQRRTFERPHLAEAQLVLRDGGRRQQGQAEQNTGVSLHASAQNLLAGALLAELVPRGQ